MNSFSTNFKNCKTLNNKLGNIKNGFQALSELYDKNTESFSKKANEFEKKMTNLII